MSEGLVLTPYQKKEGFFNMAFEYETRQTSYISTPDGQSPKPRLNRRGEQVTPDFYQQLVQDGRVFLASNAARETALAGGGTSFSDTAPAFLLDVPTGYTVMPLEIHLAQGGTVAGNVINVLVTLSDKTRYASGGGAITPQNMRFDEPYASACSFYGCGTDIVANANADDITLWAAILDQDVSTKPESTINVNWSARVNLAPLLVGPASLVIYAYAGTTEPSLFFNITWAELQTAAVT